MDTTRREILDDFLAFVGEFGDSRARDIAERLLNRIVQRIYLKRSWRQFTMAKKYEITLVAGTRSYGLPPYFARIASNDGKIRNITTGALIEPTTLEEIEQDIPTVGTSLEETGDPTSYYLAGVQGVHTQPATTGDALEVISSNGADITVKAQVEGLDANGVYTATEVTLTGVAPIAIGTWQHVERFSKAYPEGTDPTTELTSSVGSVTLRKVAGAVALQTLLPHESSREVQVLNVHPVPTGTAIVAVPIYRGPKKLLRDSDAIPAFWNEAVFGGLKKGWDVNQRRATEIPDSWPELVDLIAWENMGAVQPSAWFTR